MAVTPESRQGNRASESWREARRQRERGARYLGVAAAALAIGSFLGAQAIAEESTVRDVFAFTMFAGAGACIYGGTLRLSEAATLARHAVAIEGALAAHDLAVNGGVPQPEAPQDGGFRVAETGILRNIFGTPPPGAPPTSPQGQ